MYRINIMKKYKQSKATKGMSSIFWKQSILRATKQRQASRKSYSVCVTKKKIPFQPETLWKITVRDPAVNTLTLFLEVFNYQIGRASCRERV